MDENVRYLPNYEPSPSSERGTRRLAALLIIGSSIARVAQIAVYLLAAIGATRLLGY